MTNTVKNTIDKDNKKRHCKTREKRSKSQHRIRYMKTRRKHRSSTTRLVLATLEWKRLLVRIRNKSEEIF